MNLLQLKADSNDYHNKPTPCQECLKDQGEELIEINITGEGEKDQSPSS